VVKDGGVPLQALGGRPAHDGSDGPPLGGHQLGKMQQLLVLLHTLITLCLILIDSCSWNKSVKQSSSATLGSLLWLFDFRRRTADLCLSTFNLTQLWSRVQ
jgi:hypothetical protein